MNVCAGIGGGRGNPPPPLSLMVLSRQQKGDLHSSPCTASWAGSEIYTLGTTLLQVGEQLFILCSTNTFTKPHQSGSTQTHVRSQSRPSNERLGSQVQVLNCIRPFQVLHGQASRPSIALEGKGESVNVVFTAAPMWKVGKWESGHVFFAEEQRGSRS